MSTLLGFPARFPSFLNKILQHYNIIQVQKYVTTSDHYWNKILLDDSNSFYFLIKQDGGGSGISY